MLDVKHLRSATEEVASNLARRGFELDLAGFKSLEEARKSAQLKVDALRAERNANAKAVGMAKGKGEDASALLKRGEELNAEMATIEIELNEIQAQADHWLLNLPNLLHTSVP